MTGAGNNMRRHPVLVVGAGPAGLSAALALRAAGLPATVLEKRGVSDIRPGSRAAYLHGESLRHLERLAPGLGLRSPGTASCGPPSERSGGAARSTARPTGRIGM